MIEIPTKSSFEVVENSSGDVFLKYPNGILEIFFSRSLNFEKFGVNILSSELIYIPNDVTLVDGIHANVSIDANGTDVCLMGVNVSLLKSQRSLNKLYIYEPKGSTSLTKLIHFHVIGKWK